MILAHSSATDRGDELGQRFQALELKMQTCIESSLEMHKQAEQAKQELQVGADDDETDESESQRKNALEEVEKRSRLLAEESEALQSQLDALKTRQLIGNVDTSDDSNAVVGMP